MRRATPSRQLGCETWERPPLRRGVVGSSTAPRRPQRTAPAPHAWVRHAPLQRERWKRRAHRRPARGRPAARGRRAAGSRPRCARLTAPTTRRRRRTSTRRSCKDECDCGRHKVEADGECGQPQKYDRRNHNAASNPRTHPAAAHVVAIPGVNVNTDRLAILGPNTRRWSNHGT